MVLLLALRFDAGGRLNRPESEEIMKCPYCNTTKPNEHHHLAESNAEAYGSGFFTFQCRKCKERYSFYVERLVKVHPPYSVKRDKDLSFGL